MQETNTPFTQFVTQPRQILSNIEYIYIYIYIGGIFKIYGSTSKLS